MSKRDYRLGYRDGYKDGSGGAPAPEPNASITIHDAEGNRLGGPIKFHYVNNANSEAFSVGVERAGTAVYGIMVHAGYREVMPLNNNPRVSKYDEVTFARGSIRYVLS